MAAEEEGDGELFLFGDLPVYVEEEDPETTAAKEARAARKAEGNWDLAKIRERFAQEIAQCPPSILPSPYPDVDRNVESPIGAMRHLAVSLHGPQLVSSANIISVKVVKSAIGYPLDVYGTVFVRDELDCKRICLFRHGRDGCQRINSMDESLSLTDPSRGLVVFKNLHFEIHLKCKTHCYGKKEEEERELGNWFVTDSALTTTFSVIRNRFVGKLFTIDLTYAPAHRAVEATIDFKLCRVRRQRKRPTGYIENKWFPFNKKMKECSEFHGKLSARVSGIPEDVVLYDSKAAGCVTKVGDGGHLQLFRRVLAVPIDKIVSFSVESPDGAMVCDYWPRLRGCFSPELRVGSYMLELKVVWSTLYSRDVDGLPPRLVLQ